MSVQKNPKESLVTGTNDLLSQRPDIAAHWDFEKNGALKPSDVKINSSRPVWWLCDRGHSSSRPVNEEVKRNAPCSYCKHKKLLKGFNDLETLYPKLALEWDYKNNGDLKPSDVIAGTDKKIAWICPRGHHYTMSAWRRTSESDPRGCSVCAGKVVIEETSLAHMHPEIAALWDFKKNGETTPDKVSSGSSKDRFWIGKECGHSFMRSPKMMLKSSNCPFCTKGNTKLLKGFNDLETKFPKIACEWDDEKNGGLKPSDVLSGSKKPFWWKCDHGHSWNASVSNRTNLHSGCPQCWASSQSSRAEGELFSYISSILPKSIPIERNSRSVIFPKELDIYIPALHIAFEFNGLYWHSEMMGKDRNYHHDKWFACKSAGVQLITIWEDDWRDRREIVKNLIAHKLNVDSSSRIFARNTEARDVNNDVAEEFLNSHHLQGYKIGCKHIGLFPKLPKESISEKPVALISYRKKGETLVLERFAASHTVVGGFSKLLKRLVDLGRADSAISRIFTYSDHDISDGTSNVYSKNGFSFVGETSIDYWYVQLFSRKPQRMHRSLYQKSRFRKDSSLVYKDGLTEGELATLNDLVRVFGSGNDRFERIL